MKHIISIFCCAAFWLLVQGCATGNGNFPAPTANFTPKYTYTVPRDKLWQAILDALDKNRIAALSADKASGIIQTDYIAGPEVYIFPIDQNNRYKYNVSLRDESDGKVKLHVICTIESSTSNGHGSSQWNDVTPQNTERAAKLEAWLYEQIENRLGAS
jgi:hypothetical protein